MYIENLEATEMPARVVMMLTARQAAVLSVVYSVRGYIRSKAIASKLNLDSRDGSAKIAPALRHLLKAGLIRVEKKNKRATGYKRSLCRIPPYQIVRRGRETEDGIKLSVSELVSCHLPIDMTYCKICPQQEGECSYVGPFDHS